MSDLVYRINSPQVISETIDGETIIINLESGKYYSLNQTGGEVWKGVHAGLSLFRIQEEIGKNYPGEEASRNSAIQSFIEELLKEKLIDHGGPSSASAAATLARLEGAPSRPFEAPSLQKYEDMQDLLLLDPIHDVDEAGWPVSK